MRVHAVSAVFGVLPLALFATACSSSSTDFNAGGGGAASVDTVTAGVTVASGTTASTSAATGSGGGGGAADPPGTFVAVGSGGRRMRSTDDGITWTNDVSIVDSGGDDFVGLRTVAWGNGLFVAAGWRVMTSPDGITWADTPPAAFNQNWMGQMSFGAGSFVGLGGYGSRVTSSDGATWAQHSIDTKASHAHGSLTYVQGKGFFAMNDDGEISSSPDGVTWAYTTAKVGMSGQALAYGNGVLVAIGNGLSVTSTDGVTWSSEPAFPSMDLRALVFGQGHFSAITPEHVYTSDDGKSWVDHAAPGLYVYFAGYGHGTYVAFDVTRARRSTDGLVWTDPTELGGTNDISWVTFGPQ